MQSALYIIKTYNVDKFKCIEYTTLSALISIVQLLGKREVIETLSKEASMNIGISVTGLLGFFFAQTDLICFKNNLFLAKIDEFCDTVQGLFESLLYC